MTTLIRHSLTILTAVIVPWGGLTVALVAVFA